MTFPSRRGVAAALALALLTACGAATSSPPRATPPAVTATSSTATAGDTVSASPPAATTAASSSDAPAALTSDPLHRIELFDVTSGTTLTLGALAAEKPLLVETMAIWCSNCRSQMHQVTDAHAAADFHSVSIDVDPYEEPADLAAYAAAQGYDWAFAKANPDVAAALRERFGTAVLNPPGMPKLLFRPDGSVELLPLNDELSADEIAALVAG